MTTFGLVHGAWHGAWCWERLTPELRDRGHDVVTVELPSDDAVATFSMYADVIVEAMEAEPAGAVLVAHSMAGCRYRSRHRVYPCGRWSSCAG